MSKYGILAKNKEDVIAMWQNGATIDEIAEKYEVTYFSVNNNLRVWGIKANERNEVVPKFYVKPKEYKRETFEYDGKTYVDVTHQFIDCGG